MRKKAEFVGGRSCGAIDAGDGSAPDLVAERPEQLRAHFGIRIELCIRPRRFASMTDDQVRLNLTAVKGLGPWTADIFLMFDLLRPDILPVGDYGIQQGFRLLHRLEELPGASAMIELAQPWRPYRSHACWYLWRLLEDSRG